MDNQARIQELEEENARLYAELQATKEHLKRYTAPASRKEYYERNKEAIIERMKANPTPPDKKKEYNRQSYIRRKAKLNKVTEENPNVDNI
jgi:hypothetical protein